MDRKLLKLTSNNRENPNQNVCAMAVANALGVKDETRYLHTWGDLQRAIRKLWSFRSVKSKLRVIRGRTTVGSIRAKLAQHNEGALSYVIRVDGHVLLLDHTGQTIIDTDARQRDKRKIINIYGVYLPNDMQKLMKIKQAGDAAQERLSK